MNVSEKQVIIEYPDKNQIKLPFLDSSLISTISDYLIDHSLIQENQYILLKHNNTPLTFSRSFSSYNIKHNDIISLHTYDYPSDEYRYIDTSIDLKNEIPFTLEGIEWRKVSKGINLIGKCRNQNCKAYNEDVIAPYGYNKYDFLDKPKARCPICDMKIQVSSCALYKCGVSFKGFLYNTKSNKMKEIEIIDFTSSNISVKYYNPFDQSDENLSWNKLSVDTKRIDGIKTKQEYLTVLYPHLIKEIYLLYKNYPIKGDDSLELWRQTEDEKGKYLCSILDGEERGIFILKDHYDKYIGYLLCGMMHGEGAIINKDNEVIYKGEFKNGKKSGIGKMIIKKDVYEGEFRNDLFDGKGVYYYSNGNKWEGKFRKGKRHGMGTFTKKGEINSIVTFYFNDKLQWNFSKALEDKLKWRDADFKPENNKNINTV